jgi:hypothetical protein
VAVAQLKRLDDDARDLPVCVPDGLDVRGRADDTDTDAAVRGQAGGLADEAAGIRVEAVVVEDETGEGAGEDAVPVGQEAVLEQTSEGVALAGALAAADEG